MAPDGSSWSCDQTGVPVFWPGVPPAVFKWLCWSAWRFVQVLVSDWQILRSYHPNFNGVFRQRIVDNLCVKWQSDGRRLQGLVPRKTRYVKDTNVEITMTMVGSTPQIQKSLARNVLNNLVTQYNIIELSVPVIFMNKSKYIDFITGRKGSRQSFSLFQQYLLNKKNGETGMENRCRYWKYCARKIS